MIIMMRAMIIIMYDNNDNNSNNMPLSSSHAFISCNCAKRNSPIQHHFCRSWAVFFQALWVIHLRDSAF